MSGETCPTCGGPMGYKGRESRGPGNPVVMRRCADEQCPTWTTEREGAAT